jgi:hypothetical protein
MVKKPTTQKAKAGAKKPAPKKTVKVAARSKAAAPKTISKYDQAGAPWWKKFPSA